MKVLVTGGAGFIGSHSCKLLHAAGHETVVFDNFSTGHPYLARGTVVHGDICDTVALTRVFRDHVPDAVIHFAASAYVGDSIADPLRYYRNNVTGTAILLETMRTFGVRDLVFSSSCATYGTPELLPIAEEASQNPINPYGETKLIGEQMMRWLVNLGELNAIALRYFNAAGADPDGDLGELHSPETHLIPLVLAATRTPELPISVFGTDYPTPDGTCIRDYLHVADLARAHVQALEALGDATEFRAYNLGTGRGFSIKEIIATAEQVTGRPAAVCYAPRRPGDPPVLVADAQRAHDELGWSPALSDLSTIIDTAWRWMRSGRNPFNATR